MTRYCIMPVEATEKMLIEALRGICEDSRGIKYEPEPIDKGRDAVWLRDARAVFNSMLAARPPLDKEMQGALELARAWSDTPNYEYGGVIGAVHKLSHALLRANGELE